MYNHSAAVIWRTDQYWNSYILFILLRGEMGISAVLASSSTQLMSTLRLGDPPGVVLHGKQPWHVRTKYIFNTA